MSKKILINATQAEELRLALVDGQWLYDLVIEVKGKEQRNGNIYFARVSRVEQSLEAGFLDFGGSKSGFLPFRQAGLRHDATLHEGQQLIVQLDKEERGNKGASFTTHISLAGCYLVLMPNNAHGGGISRRIEGEERSEMRDILMQLQIPEGMSVIIRTAGVGRSIQQLQWDLNVLLQQWDAIQQATRQQTAPFLIYQESDAVIRAIRDHLHADISEIVVDSPRVYERICSYIRLMRPDFVGKVRLYEDTVPLFYDIEAQIRSAFENEVQLPSGAAIVIQKTEAMVTIDVNSAKSTKAEDIATTALNTNLEAAKEIARQLRLRDIGGLVVIDFIDMPKDDCRKKVEECLKEALSMDRARMQVCNISSLGLLEMSRQRLRPALHEARELGCPRCRGFGTVPNAEAMALQVLRVVEEEAIRKQAAEIVAEVPVDVASYIMNEKRESLAGIEKRQYLRIWLLPNVHMVSPEYKLHYSHLKSVTPQAAETGYVGQMLQKVTTEYTPMVANFSERLPTEFVQRTGTEGGRKERGLIKRLWSSIVGAEEEGPEAPELGNMLYPSEERSGVSRNGQQGRRRQRRPRLTEKTGRISKTPTDGNNNNKHGVRHRNKPEQRAAFATTDTEVEHGPLLVVDDDNRGNVVISDEAGANAQKNRVNPRRRRRHRSNPNKVRPYDANVSNNVSNTVDSAED
jgi:ribonuclease E